VLALEARPEPWFDAGYSRETLIREVLGHGYILTGLSITYDDFNLYRLDQFDNAGVVNIIAIPRQRGHLLEGLGAIGVD
jgi:hypothetical protein